MPVAMPNDRKKMVVNKITVNEKALDLIVLLLV